MSTKLNLSNIAIVLTGTRYPENIGAAARAMLNMGIERLILVDPQNYDTARVNKMATHAASVVVEKLEVYDSLKEALADFNYVVGTTARLGGQRKVVSSPAKLAQKLVPLSDQNRIAILFGPEDRGLSNVDLRSCHILVNIPTAEFSSLNLAQAVMVMCYELFRFSLDKPGINPDNPDYFMNNLRHFFTRMQLRAKEVQIIRGLCRQVNWYGKKRYEDGLKQRQEDPGG